MDTDEDEAYFQSLTLKIYGEVGKCFDSIVTRLSTMDSSAAASVLQNGTIECYTINKTRNFRMIK